VLHPAMPLTDLDDSTLISQRREMRTALEKLPPKSQAAQSLIKQYDALTAEFGRRVAWAVDTLLADPEALGNDALETDLYLLREKLQEQAGG
jgi:signal transduction histidine kinase